jgi:hypothetical protein
VIGRQLALTGRETPRVSPSNDHSMSQYIRFSPICSAINHYALSFSQGQIRFFTEAEASGLAEYVRKKNTFVRTAGPDSFYPSRIRALGSKTVIEVFLPGQPDQTVERAQDIAVLYEKTALLASLLFVPREELHKKLALTHHRWTVSDVLVGPHAYNIRSKTKKQPELLGVRVDAKFSKKFHGLGFPALPDVLSSNIDVSRRLQASVFWLAESATETEWFASIVKTSVALESLLIFDESEPLSRCLSERAALILSADPDTRSRISQCLKVYYDVRSGIVHGGRKKLKKLTPELSQSVDKLAVLLCLTIAVNSDIWANDETLRLWCDSQRWNAPATVRTTFSDSYLKGIVETAEPQNLHTKEPSQAN